MAEHTTIEWTDATWNPITGCSVVSPGCTNCYAMRLAGTRLQHHPSRAGLTRDTKAGPVWTGDVRLNEQWLDQPLHWKKPRNIFVCAHGDLFHAGVPDEWIDRVFSIMARAHWHTFQVLTKRDARMRGYMTDARTPLRVEDLTSQWRDRHGYLIGVPEWPLPNVWLGVSVEDQARADERIPKLLATPAAVRWISAEPLLGPVDLDQAWHGESALDSECWGDCAWCSKGHPPLHNCQKGKGDWERGRSGIDWVVAGGESGPGARPMHPDWARSLRDQCAAAGVPYFHKQNGEWVDTHDAGYSTWEATRPGYGRVGGFIGRGVPGLDGTEWETLWPFLTPADPGPVMIRIGKKAAGRLLDGREHNEVPT